MTTITYKDGVVAFDTLVTQGHTIIGHDHHKARLFTFDSHSIIVGAAGVAGTCEKCFNWARTNFSSEHKPQEEALENLDGFIVDNKGRKFLINGNFAPFEISTDILALGSGSDIALGAMLNGASAIEAVKLAAKYNIGTGGKIKQLKFKEN